MTDFFLIIFSTALVNNIIVELVFGADPALSFNRKLETAIGISVTLVVLLPLATFISALTEYLLIQPFDLDYLRLLIFITEILFLVWCLKAFIPRISKTLDERINIFLPIAGINATVLGTMLLFQQMVQGVVNSLIFGLGTALGFSLLLIIYTAITERLEAADIPMPFRGLSILMITLGLISMAFMGFAGLIQI